MCKIKPRSEIYEPMGLTEFGDNDIVLMIQSWFTVFDTKESAFDAVKHIRVVAESHGLTKQWTPTWRGFRVTGISPVGHEIVSPDRLKKEASGDS